MQTTLFVDGSYLFQILRRTGVSRLNYDLFGPAMLGRGTEPIVYLYETYPWPREGEEPAVYWERVEAKRRYLRAVGQSRRMRIRIPEPVPGPPGGPFPGGHPPAPDVMAAVDVVRLVQHSRIQRIVLVWADEAIVPAVEHVREEGVIVQLLHGGEGQGAHGRLLRAVDEADVITEEMLRRAEASPTARA